MRSKLAMMLAALGAAIVIGSGPVSAAPVTGSAAEAARASSGQPLVEEVGRRHRHWRRHYYGPRVYGWYGRPYYRRHFYRPYYYGSPYHYGGYPYYYRRRPGFYFGFGF